MKAWLALGVMAMLVAGVAAECRLSVTAAPYFWRDQDYNVRKHDAPSLAGCGAEAESAVSSGFMSTINAPAIMTDAVRAEMTTAAGQQGGGGGLEISKGPGSTFDIRFGLVRWIGTLNCNARQIEVRDGHDHWPGPGEFNGYCRARVDCHMSFHSPQLPSCATPPPPCPSMRVNVNLIGGDISRANAWSPQQCCDLCRVVPNCAAWTWAGPNSPILLGTARHTCFLKRSTGWYLTDASPAYELVSGIM